MDEVCDKMERFGKAIGNATRYSIVQTLAGGPKTVSELVHIVGGSQSAISQHLKILKLSDIVTSERSAQEVYYRLNAQHALGLLKALVDNFKKDRR